MNIRSVWHAIASVARKEFLHVWRDKRILALILILPPFFTLLFGYAFEATELTGVPGDDHRPRPVRAKCKARARLLAAKKKTFAWKKASRTPASIPILLRSPHHRRGGHSERLDQARIEDRPIASAAEVFFSTAPMRPPPRNSKAGSAKCIGEFPRPATKVCSELIIVKPLLEELPSEVFDAMKAMKPEGPREAEGGIPTNS